VLFFNRHLSTSQTPKQEFQKWLDSIRFDLFITVEPTPSSPMKDDDIKSRIREIDMEINRHFIGNQFSNYKNKMDRCWMIGFFEDGHKGRRMRHTHLLYHLPFSQFRNRKGSDSFLRNMVRNEFQIQWSLIKPSVQVVTNTQKTKNWFEVVDFDTRNIPPIHIEQISSRKDSQIVGRYSSKEIHRSVNYDDYYFSF
jgi:hypothetical protein